MMWKPSREAYPEHHEIVDWHLHGKPSSWSEPDFEWPKFAWIQAKLQEVCPPPKQLLDVGCFTGYLLRRLAERGYRGVGIDLQRDLMVASEQLARLGRTPLSFRFCGAESCDGVFPAGCFDAVLALDVLEHTLDERRALDSLRTVCQPGGWLFFHLPQEDHDSAEHVRDYGPADLQALAAQLVEGRVEEGVDELGRRTAWVYGRN